MRARRIAPVTLLFVVCALAAPAGVCGGADDFCPAELLRIETAYRAGLGKAAGPEEVLSCLRARNEALDLLVERSYQAALVWLADRGGMQKALEEDQGRWQDRLFALSASCRGSVPDRRAALEEESRLLLERLDLIGKVTSERLFRVEAR